MEWRDAGARAVDGRETEGAAPGRLHVANQVDVLRSLRAP